MAQTISLSSAQSMINDTPTVAAAAGNQFKNQAFGGGTPGASIGRQLTAVSSERRTSKFLDEIARNPDIDYKTFVKSAAMQGVIDNPRVVAYASLLKDKYTMDTDKQIADENQQRVISEDERSYKTGVQREGEAFNLQQGRGKERGDVITLLNDSVMTNPDFDKSAKTPQDFLEYATAVAKKMPKTFTDDVLLEAFKTYNELWKNTFQQEKLNEQRLKAEQEKRDRITAAAKAQQDATEKYLVGFNTETQKAINSATANVAKAKNPGAKQAAQKTLDDLNVRYNTGVYALDASKSFPGYDAQVYLSAGGQAAKTPYYNKIIADFANLVEKSENFEAALNTAKKFDYDPNELKRIFSVKRTKDGTEELVVNPEFAMWADYASGKGTAPTEVEVWMASMKKAGKPQRPQMDRTSTQSSSSSGSVGGGTQTQQPSEPPKNGVFKSTYNGKPAMIEFKDGKPVALVNYINE
jgi:hypothetical protein